MLLLETDCSIKTWNYNRHLQSFCVSVRSMNQISFVNLLGVSDECFPRLITVPSPLPGDETRYWICSINPNVMVGEMMKWTKHSSEFRYASLKVRVRHNNFHRRKWLAIALWRIPLLNLHYLRFSVFSGYKKGTAGNNAVNNTTT